MIALLEHPCVFAYIQGYRTKNIFNKCLDQEVLKWACNFRSTLCINVANGKLRNYIENPGQNK